MNKIFVLLSAVSVVTGLLFGRGAVMTEAILTLPSQVFDLTIRLMVNACLWNGLLELANASGLIAKLSCLLNPFFGRLYPDIKENKEVMGLITSNFIANFLGLGNLAMISGLKAMHELDQLQTEHQKASRSMKTLIIFNTTGCSLFPMSIAALRSNFASADPLGFAGYTLLIGVITLSVGILMQKGAAHFE